MTGAKAERISDYLEHIISSIAQIQKYASGMDQTAFIENDMVQDAVIRQLEIIGEASRRIISADPAFSKNQPALELEAAYRMLNALAHGYDSVNLRTVWGTIEQKLPLLKAESTRLLTTYTKR
jgi:uncharacterized protein with HEPN domain